MDVERLMRDLTIEQLAEIYSSLSKEIETKKEDLRQMVGRRYRDVLEASNTVKRLNELSYEIVKELGDTKAVLTSFEKRTAGLEQSKGKRLTRQRFILLNAILPLLDEPINGITDAFTLLIAECLQRAIALDGNDLENNSEVMIRALGDQLINHRLKLKQRLLSELGDITEWTSLAGQLVGLGILNQSSPESLLKNYLEARLLTITSTLESSTLIGIISQIKETTEAVNKVFGAGKGLYLCFNAVTTEGWCPDVIRTEIRDQLSVHNRLFETELVKANRAYRADFTAVPEDQVVAAVAEWVNELCATAKDNVSKITRFFESSDELVDFILAANELFRHEWPGVEDPLTIYRGLFGNALSERFGQLIGTEVRDMETELMDKIPKVNCNPPPLFHKRATKFDGLLASGVSQELNGVVQKFFERLRNLNHRTNKYIHLGHEENIEELRRFLAEEIIGFLKRLTGKHDEDIAQRDPSVTILPSDENQRWLKEFRLYLALVQFEPSVISQCMGDDTQSAVEANKILHQAAEKALCHLMDYIIEEAVQDSELNKVKEACEQPFKWIDYVQNCEKIQLGTSIETPIKTESKTVEIDLNEEKKSEDVKVEEEKENAEQKEQGVQAFIEIPTQINRQLFAFLYSICRRISQNSFGHLFTRNVSVHVSSRLSHLISTLLKESAEAAPEHTTLILTQLLFDSRTMAQMFPSKEFVRVVEVIKNKMDVVDWKLVDEPVAKNARIAVKRSAMLFGQLQTDPPTGSSITSKETTQQAVIDVLPRIEGTLRIPAIPRLSKIKEEEKKAKLKAKQAADAKRQNAEKNINLGGFFDYFMKN